MLSFSHVCLIFNVVCVMLFFLSPVCNFLCLRCVAADGEIKIIYMYVCWNNAHSYSKTASFDLEYHIA